MVMSLTLTQTQQQQLAGKLERQENLPANEHYQKRGMRPFSERRFAHSGCLSAVLVLAIGNYGSLIRSGSCLSIDRPAPSEAVLLDDGGGVEVVIDIERLMVPTHGFLSLLVDGEALAVLCPGLASSLSLCPTAGQEHGLTGKIKTRISAIVPGERVLTAVISDANMATVEELSVVFWAGEQIEGDEEVLGGQTAFNLIIFSKDRACQLDQLLTSIEEHVPNHNTPMLRIQVLYTFSPSGNYGKAYDLVEKAHPEVKFHHEGNLSASVSSVYSDAFISAGGAMQGFKVRSQNSRHPQSSTQPRVRTLAGLCLIHTHKCVSFNSSPERPFVLEQCCTFCSLKIHFTSLQKRCISS